MKITIILIAFLIINVYQEFRLWAMRQDLNRLWEFNEITTRGLEEIKSLIEELMERYNRLH